MNYGRLTYKDKSLPRMRDGKLIKAYCDYSVREIINRLSELEDKIEEGILIELPVKYSTTADIGKVWGKNLEHLMCGGFGDPIHAETLLNYWMAQEQAGYPYASENVKYFEEMVEIERCKIGMLK